jgi:large subunit ribosomal protein L15
MARKKEEAAVEKVTLSTLKPADGATHYRKRLGRGPGSGLGKTSGKGHKGQKARAGKTVNPGFEGGQMPMFRRMPKRGFTNPFKVTAQPVNVKDLVKVTAPEVNPETLHTAGLISKAGQPVKVLGTGEVSRAFVLRGVAVSASARAKIEQAGGRIEE